MDTSVQHMIFDIPWDVLDASSGFALDMGGSVLKLMYVHKKDWVEPAKRTTNTGKLRLKLFTHAEFHDGKAYKFIKENVYIRQREDGKLPSVCGTGFMVSMQGEAMKKELAVNITCLMESDCFIQAFHYAMRNLPKKEVLYTIPAEEDKKVKAFCHSLVGLYSKTWLSAPRIKGGLTPDEIASFFDVDGDVVNDGQVLINQKDIFPCVLGMCGSGFAVMPLHEDYTYGMSDMSTRGGRMWLGIGSLLTGGSDYEKLMELAAAGNSENLDITSIDLFAEQQSGAKSEKSDDIYKTGLPQAIDTFTIMSMAKAENKTIGDFKKEDIARSFLQIMVTDLVTTIHGSAILSKAKHVFLSGGFVEHPLTRSMIYKEFLVIDSQSRCFNQRKERIYCHFLRGGQFYGAFGALLNHKLKFNEIKDPAENKQ